jgi:(E)-4-hydroxy-3-methylbut-2-enyl-diphosphate synthase
MLVEPRRQTPTVWVGAVPIGSSHAIVVQAMTDTPTADVEATVSQAARLARAGAELVRVTVNDEAAARAVPQISARLRDEGVLVPLIGDFHYNGHALLREFPECARVLAKFRVNPGNVGFGGGQDRNFAEFVALAREHEKPIRIGVNWGSLDRDLLKRRLDENARRSEPADVRAVMRHAMVESALRSAEFAEKQGLPHDRIVLSAKASDVSDLVAANVALAGETDIPLHLGLTEAGPGAQGEIGTAVGLALLLERGIGDTIRASLTPGPGGDRSDEVRLCRHVLQALGIRHFFPRVTACPGCGRTRSTFFRELAERVRLYLEEKMPEWSERYPGVEELNVAVMGCVVNGPGESRYADVGISLPGMGEAPQAPVYFDSKRHTTLRGEAIAEDFLRLLEEYVEARYAPTDSHSSNNDL